MILACATHTRPVTVRIPDYEAPSGSSPLSSLAPLTVQVLPFRDARKELKGEVTAAFGMPMGHVRFDQSPATLLMQVVLSELKAGGHSVVDHAEGPRIVGTVREFQTHTDTTPFYWDVIGNLAVSLQVSRGRESHPGSALEYQTRCTDRTYLYPSASFIAGAMRKCINDFASAFRTDGRAAEALRQASSSQ
jgi:hypothetical protein